MRKRQIDLIPQEFASYEQAAEFWDTHDTTDYSNDFETVETETELKRRRYEVEIDADLFPALTEQAHKRGVAVKIVVSDLLREKFSPTA